MRLKVTVATRLSLGVLGVELRRLALLAAFSAVPYWLRRLLRTKFLSPISLSLRYVVHIFGHQSGIFAQ